MKKSLTTLAVLIAFATPATATLMRDFVLDMFALNPVTMCR